MLTNLNNLYSWLRTQIEANGGKLRLIDEDSLDSLSGTNSKIENEWFLSIKAIAPRVMDLDSGQMELEFGLVGAWSTTGDPTKLARILTKCKGVFVSLTSGNLPTGTLFIEVVEPAPMGERMGITTIEYTVKVMLSTEEV